MEIIIKIDCDAEDLSNSNKKSGTENGKCDASIYARFFNSSCPGWSKDPEMNKLFLKQIENYFNDRLRAQGYLFLNDVYEHLGFARSRIGQVVGWLYDEKNPIGDNYVDFDIFSDRNQEFINGMNTDALLDFNVDGNLLDRI